MQRFWLRLALASLAVGTAAGALATSGAALGIDDARLLLTRTGFGATPVEVADFAPLSRMQAVDRLLGATSTIAITPPPAELGDPASMSRPGRNASDDERKAFRRQQVEAGLALRAWWLREMLVTPSPLTERMTLFWHGHFATSQQKVLFATLMYRQNVTLRANALGNFGSLLHAASKDPAMLIYLDTVQNRRGHPNENFAREVMELFTLGEGHYSEQDIKEAARAFTGWSIDRNSGTFVFRPRLHDDGVKTVFGHTGNFDGDAVLDLILARPETAEFITSELWREFISPDPDEREVSRIAARFRASNYDIKTVLRELFENDAFYATQTRGALVKSPVDLVAGTLHTLDILPANTLPFAVACASMGQNLFSPPNVRGWPGGEAWINTNTLLARKQFLERITRADNFGAAPTKTANADDGATATRFEILGGVPTMSSHDVSTTMHAGNAMRKPQGIEIDAVGARQQRFARAMDRGMRDLAFDADRWNTQLPRGSGSDPRARTLRLLLPIAAVDAAAITGDTPSVVRAALQDDSYQLE